MTARIEAKHFWGHQVGQGFDLCIYCDQRVKCDGESGPAHTRDETTVQHSEEGK